MQTPATATKRRRISQMCLPCETAQEVQPEQVHESPPIDTSNVDATLAPAHVAFRMARLRLQHALPAAYHHEGIVRPTLDQVEGANSTTSAPGHQTLPAVCYGFFSSKRANQSEKPRSLPPIGYNSARTYSPFSRTPAFCVDCPPGCTGDSTDACTCMWCIQRKCIEQDREELMLLYLDAKACGSVVDPSD